MVLVDTCIWVDHLRRGDNTLVRLLDDEQVMCHPFVIGELACGHLSRRDDVLSSLAALPLAAKVEDDEVLAFIAQHHLMHRGLGLIDVHLLASCMLMKVSLWTRDRRLKSQAVLLRLHIEP